MYTRRRPTSTSPLSWKNELETSFETSPTSTLEPGSSLDQELYDSVGGQDPGTQPRQLNRLTKFTRSLTGKDKKELKIKVSELEEKVQRLEAENEDYKIAVAKLQQSLSKTTIHTGPVQYGDGNNVYIIEQAEDTIELLNEMLEDTLKRIAELQQTADRNEKKLEEYRQEVNGWMRDMKKTNVESNEMINKLEKLIVDMSGDLTDAHVLAEGIRAIKQDYQRRGFNTDFRKMSAKSKRAVRRTVNKYDTTLDYKEFAKHLNVDQSASVQEILEEGTSQSSHRIGETNCAKILVEWAKKPENTPEKFVEATTKIDQIVIEDKTGQLRTEFLQKTKRKSRASDKSNSIKSFRSGTSEFNRHENSGLLRELLANNSRHGDFQAEINKKLDGLPKFLEDTIAIALSSVEKKQDDLLNSLRNMKDDLPKYAVTKQIGNPKVYV